ncbi:hypothetical protein MKX03_011137 [Papaver bracteatum]|nr:hypothetical protein MKX03_011137 [Papaver bracteatum]
MEIVYLFKMGFESFIRKYEKRYPGVVKYICDSVLVNKEFFAHAWTNEVKHFGVRTSNRVVHIMHESQLVTIKAKFQQSLSVIKHEHNINDFKGLHHHVSQYSLDFLITEIKRLEKSRSVVENLCGCILYKMHGLPYPSHFLISILNGGRSIWHHMLHVMMLYFIIFHN